MELQTARSLGLEVTEILSPLCAPERCEIAGSIRRGRPLCNDVDIVLVPGTGCQGRLALALRDLGQTIAAGPRMHSCLYRGQRIDIYIATAATWWTLLLIRTGSKQHNISMCSRAKALEMKLHADGSGISRDNGTLIQPATEEDIFRILRLPYKPPEERG